MALFILSLDGTWYSSKRIIHLQNLQQMRAHICWPRHLFVHFSCWLSFCIQSTLFSTTPTAQLFSCLLSRLPACSCVLCSILPFQSKIKAPQQEVLGAQVGRTVSLWKMPAGANPSRHEYSSWPMCSLMTVSLDSFSKVLELGRDMFPLHLICVVANTELSIVLAYTRVNYYLKRFTVNSTVCSDCCHTESRFWCQYISNTS